MKKKTKEKKNEHKKLKYQSHQVIIRVRELSHQCVATVYMMSESRMLS